ncbi:30S ribosomal protein S17 [Candidatus Woesearchaeota archaeon]|nr:30S ribosomal protein S17 [Candidatus Woesearchaeota archaeon]
MKTSTHGRTFVGTVVAAKMQDTATVEWERSRYIPKYERFEKLTTRVKAHNPENIDAKKGDIVKIMECRPLSKTKNFVIIEKIGHEEFFEAEEELKQESKFKVAEEKNESSQSENN